MTQQSSQNLLIEVTQEDIDTALRNNSSHCAVATAISRQVDALRVAVDIQTVRMTMRGTNQRRIYLTPAKAQQYIVDFDAGNELKPFTFWMKRPAWVTHTRNYRLEEGNNAEIIPVRDMTEVNIHQGVGTEGDQPAYVGMPRRRAPVPRQSRQATRREYGLRMMRINQEYSRSDTKQYGRNRKVQKAVAEDSQDEQN